MMRLLLLLLLMATQSLGEVDSSGTYGAGEQSPSGDVSREAKSDGFLGTSASTGEEEMPLSNSTDPLSGLSPANLNGSRRRSPGSPPAPCSVNTVGNALACDAAAEEFKGTTINSVIDFSTLGDVQFSFIKDKKKLSGISMRMIGGSHISKFEFPNMVEWTGASGEDSIFEGNTALTKINLEVLDTLSVKKLVIRNNPILKHIQFGPLTMMAATEGFHLTKNPSLNAFATQGNDQTVSHLTVRGNKLLKFIVWTGKPGSSIHKDKGECGFWEPVKSLTELDGCQEVYEDLEFAPNVTDATRSKISKIGGDLNIVGTDLATLDFFDFTSSPDGMLVGGTVSFSDNLGICDKDFIFSKNTYKTDCPTTTPAPTTEPSTTVDVSTSVAGGGVPGGVPRGVPGGAPGGVPGGGPVPATSPAPPTTTKSPEQIEEEQDIEDFNQREMIAFITGIVVLLLALLATAITAFLLLRSAVWKEQEEGDADAKAEAKKEKSIYQTDLEKAKKMQAEAYRPPIDRHHQRRRRRRRWGRRTRRLGWPLSKRSVRECFQYRKRKRRYQYHRELSCQFLKRLRWGRLSSMDRRWAEVKSQTLKQYPLNERRRWTKACTDPYSSGIRNPQFPRLDATMPKVSVDKDGDWKYVPATFFGPDDKFILSPAPLPHESWDLWSMVEKLNVRTIVAIGDTCTFVSKSRNGPFGQPDYYPHSKQERFMCIDNPTTRRRPPAPPYLIAAKNAKRRKRNPKAREVDRVSSTDSEEESGLYVDILMQACSRQLVHPDRKRDFCSMRLTCMASRNGNMRRCLRYKSNKKNKCAKCGPKFEEWVKEVNKEERLVKKVQTHWRDFNYKKTTRRRGRKNWDMTAGYPNAMFARMTYLKLWRRGLHFERSQVEDLMDRKKRRRRAGKAKLALYKTRRGERAQAKPEKRRKKRKKVSGGAADGKKAVSFSAPAPAAAATKRTGAGADPKPLKSALKSTPSPGPKPTPSPGAKPSSSKPSINWEKRSNVKKGKHVLFARMDDVQKRGYWRKERLERQRAVLVAEAKARGRDKKAKWLAHTGNTIRREGEEDEEECYVREEKRARKMADWYKTRKEAVTADRKKRFPKAETTAQVRKERRKESKPSRLERCKKRIQDKAKAPKAKKEKKKGGRVKRVKIWSKVMHVQISNWTPNELPSIERLVNLAILVNKAPGKVLVHSLHGMDRGPTFAIICCLLERLRRNQPLPDIWALCRRMRTHLPNSLNRSYCIHTIFMAVMHYMRRYRRKFRVPPRLWRAMKVYYRRCLFRYASQSAGPLRDMMLRDLLEPREPVAIKRVVAKQYGNEPAKDQEDRLHQVKPKRRRHTKKAGFRRRKTAQLTREKERARTERRGRRFIKAALELCRRNRRRQLARRGRGLKGRKLRGAAPRRRELKRHQLRRAVAFKTRQMCGYRMRSFNKWRLGLTRRIVVALSNEKFLSCCRRKLYARFRKTTRWLTTTRLFDKKNEGIRARLEEAQLAPDAAVKEHLRTSIKRKKKRRRGGESDWTASWSSAEAQSSSEDGLGEDWSSSDSDTDISLAATEYTASAASSSDNDEEERPAEPTYDDLAGALADVWLGRVRPMYANDGRRTDGLVRKRKGLRRLKETRALWRMRAKATFTFEIVEAKESQKRFPKELEQRNAIEKKSGRCFFPRRFSLPRLAVKRALQTASVMQDDNRRLEREWDKIDAKTEKRRKAMERPKFKRYLEEAQQGRNGKMVYGKDAKRHRKNAVKGTKIKRNRAWETDADERRSSPIHKAYATLMKGRKRKTPLAKRLSEAAAAAKKSKEAGPGTKKTTTTATKTDGPAAEPKKKDAAAAAAPADSKPTPEPVKTAAAADPAKKNTPNTTK